MKSFGLVVCIVAALLVVEVWSRSADGTRTASLDEKRHANCGRGGRGRGPPGGQGPPGQPPAQIPGQTFPPSNATGLPPPLTTRPANTTAG